MTFPALCKPANISPHVREDLVKALFLDAINEYFRDPSEIVQDLQLTIKAVKDSDPASEITSIESELEVTGKLIMDHLTDGSETEELYKRYSALEEKQHELEKLQQELHLNIIKLKKLIKLLEFGNKLPIEFDERLWTATIDKVTVYKDKLIFTFFDGTEITETIK